MRSSQCWLLALASCGRVDFDPDPCVKQLSAGQFHTCMLRSDGTIRCWGSNAFGQIGNGTLVDQALPVNVLVAPAGPPFDRALAVSCGVENSTCALRDDHTAWCWGENANGQLGDGTLVDAATPVQVMAQDGVALTNIAEIVMGEQHACARMMDGTLQCWGLNSSGQLGDGTTTTRAYPVEVLTAGGSPFVAADLTISVATMCAWDPIGGLFCWGGNADGEVGDGSLMDRSLPVAIGVSPTTSAAMGWRTGCASVADGTAYCWGYGLDGSLGDGTFVSRPQPGAVLAGGVALDHVVAVGSGDSTDCALRDDGSVWCWGGNGLGQLGIGDPNTSASPQPLEVLLPQPATQLAVGNDHLCVRLLDGAIACWGYNMYGQLGDGTTTTAFAPVLAVATGCP
jgi:alpha-tubulin suppressor-like RCC1 family protein